MVGVIGNMTALDRSLINETRSQQVDKFRA